MHHIVVLLIGLAAASSLPLEDGFAEHILKWQKFMTQFGKKYETKEEELKRFELFHANLKLIEEHNARYRKGLESYTMKLNRFSDMTKEERAKFHGFQRVLTKKDIYFLNFLKPTDVDIPETVDWRKRGFVTPVKNQGDCASCWAFSAVGSLEGQIKRKTGLLVALSAQNLIDCSESYGNNGCNGGEMEYSFKYVMENGIDTEESYPYEEMVKTCRFNNTAIDAKLINYTKIASRDEEELKQAVATVGPISAGVHFPDAADSYEGGVFYVANCSEVSNHAVTIVGYGTEEETGLDYWIVKNSWSKDWGDNGYMLISRNRNNSCGIATDALFPNFE